jgi:hypothetical protein
MKQVKFKYQSVVVDIDASTAVGTYAEKVQLDEEYDECVGIAVHEIDDGSITDGYWQLGISDRSKTHHDLVAIDNWDTNANVAPNLKFKDINFPVKRSFQTSIDYYLPAVPSNAMKVEVIFKLQKTLIEK